MAAQVNLYVVVDEAGDFGYGTDYDGAIENYREDISEDVCLLRGVSIVLTVPLPEAIKVNGVIPEEKCKDIQLEVQ